MTLFSRLAAAAALVTVTCAFAQAPSVPPPPPLPPVGLELIWAPWGPAGAQPPQGSSVLMGGFVSGQPGGPLPVCRAAHQNGVHPGKFWQGRCYIGWGGQEVAVEKFEMLFFRPAPNLGQVSWVNAGGPTPPNAVVGGQEPGRQLGVCRTLAPNGWHPGKLIDGRCSIGFGGREVMAPQYQLLVQAGPGVAQAPQAALPAGSYRQTCTNVSMNGPNLSATCRNIAGQMVPATLSIAGAPAGQDIANCDGKLVAGSCQPPAVTNGVRIVRADYGLNCRTPRSDVSIHAALACNGKASCSYKVDHTQIGDTAPGCAKEYQVAYECVASGQAVSRGKGALGPEASGKTVELPCPTMAPVTAGIKVTGAEYGTNCRAPAFYADVTQHISAACNGKDACAYKVDHTAIGDTAFGCAKDYKVSYECVGKGVAGTAVVASEASGRSIGLACPQ